MKVFKFGGASVSSVERIKNVAHLLRNLSSEPIVVVVSAMGKATNALEKVVDAFYQGNQAEALALFEAVKQSHLTTAKYLLVKNYNAALEQLLNYFTEVEWLLYDKAVRDYDYYYDQVVCVGEMLSTCLVSAHLNEAGIDNILLDVRDVLRTNDVFRDAAIDWETSTANIQQYVADYGQKMIVTQGFVGSTDANESTTLGREGSDFSAAIFANILNAESLTIWKDVEGVMNADPRLFVDATWLSELSYLEVIEMAYYGAQVIHPKTIKPLQNKQIPLYVKSFIDPSLPGTVISRKNAKDLPPIKVVKNKQVLMHLRTLDFSFASEAPMSHLDQILDNLHIKPNLLQIGAINIELCVDEHEEKNQLLAMAASTVFDVQVDKNLTLLTIRHFTNKVLEELTTSKKIELLQQTRETVQVLYREADE